MKLQKDAMDCGLVVIQALHKYYYDNWIPINQIKEKFNLGLEGLNILELTNLGQNYGLFLESFEGDFDSLKEFKISKPMISLIQEKNTKHYIIITKIKNNKIHYYDPVWGKKRISFQIFQKIFQNIIIVVTKTSFQSKAKKSKEKITYVNYKITTLLILLNIIILALSFLATFYLKIILDKVIPGGMAQGLIYITLAFGLMATIKIITICFKSLLTQKITNKISFYYLNLYFNKLYFCNIAQLDNITKSDHLRRIATIKNIASFKANYIFIISNEIISFLFSVIMLITISPKIFTIVAVISIFIITISFLFQKNIKSKNQHLLDSNLEFTSRTFDLISTPLEMKQTNIKNLIQKNLDNSLEKNYHLNFKIFNLMNFHKTIMEIIKIMIPFIIVFISCLEIFNSSLTIGEMIMFISIFAFFIEPLDSFLALLLNIPVVKQDIELLNFILDLEEETSEGIINQKIEKIEFENYSFCYHLGKPVVEIKKFMIQNNIQIKGPNGSGKSTFLKIIATYLFGEGQYNINHIDAKSYNLKSIRQNIFYASNKTFLPNVSILQYLTNNEKNKIEKLQENFIKYKLHHIFNIFHVKIEDNIIDNGANFSSGQKQFIILLPLLISNYQLILLDETFDNIEESSFIALSKLIRTIQGGNLFIEISHNQKFLYRNEVIDFETINYYK